MKLFEIADRYCKESDWKTLALLKFCLFSMGVIAGTQLPHKKRKLVLSTAFAVFMATYVPLMYKFFQICASVKQEQT